MALGTITDQCNSLLAVCSEFIEPELSAEAERLRDLARICDAAYADFAEQAEKVRALLHERSGEGGL
jgi:hypothetical protein